MSRINASASLDYWKDTEMSFGPFHIPWKTLKVIFDLGEERLTTFSWSI